MPTRPSAAFSINGAPVGAKVAVAAGGAIVATLDDPTGCAPVLWSVVNVDDTSATTDYALVYAGTGPCTTTALTAGKSGELKCTVSGGVDPTTGYADEELMSYSVKFYVATTAALETLVSGELEESNTIGSPTHGAIAAINLAIRLLGGTGSLVTTTALGTVNATGATANAVFQSGAPTVGGAWSTYLSLGVVPATAGDVRLHDTASIQKWCTGPVDMTMMAGTAADDINIGLGSAAGAKPPNINYGCNTLHTFYANGNARLAVFDAAVKVSSQQLRFGIGVAAPSIVQEDDPAAGITGDDLAVRAQSVSDPAGGAISGDFGVTGGKGTVHAGNKDGNVWVHIAPGAGDFQSMEMGTFVANCVTAPTGNPSAGAFDYVESGATKVRSSGGVVNTVSPVGSTVTIKRDIIAVGGQSAGGGTVDLLSYAIANGQILHAHVTAGARDTVTGEVASYERIATFEQTAGGMVLVGAVSTPHTAEEDAGWDATLLVVGAAAVFRGTGDAANATDWDIWADLTIVG